jgi:hypothetical protein
MQLYSMISYIKTESFFEELKYGALSASFAKSGSVVLMLSFGVCFNQFCVGTG